MYSMTGFGREELQKEETEIIVEMKTVNHRYLDISFHMPKFLYAIEHQLKKEIRKLIKRGKVNVSVFMEGKHANQKVLKTDWELAEQYIMSLKQLQEEYQLSGTVSIDLLTRLPDLFQAEDKEEIDSETEALIIQSLAKATEKVQRMRLKEGVELQKDLSERMKKMKNTVKQLGDRRKVVIIEYQERILDRLNSYLADTSIYDESKLLQEVALLAEKGDITEEITRIHSHIKQFENIMKDGSLIGRKLDFIIQEINRELNTIGSKSNDTWISEQIIYMKSEAEKIKEQIQNIE